MSGRADKVHATGPSQPHTQPVPAETFFSRKDFLAAQKEAQQLGTPGQCFAFAFQARVPEGSQGGLFGSKQPPWLVPAMTQPSHLLQRAFQMWLRCKAPATGTRSLCCWRAHAAGAEAMQPHSKRQLEAQNLAKLGMKAKPQQRMGAKIGLSGSCFPLLEGCSGSTFHLAHACSSCWFAWRSCCRFEQAPPAWRFGASSPTPERWLYPLQGTEVRSLLLQTTSRTRWLASRRLSKRLLPLGC